MKLQLFSLYVGRLLMLTLFTVPVAVFATTVTINFEGLSDSTFVTNQYAGLTFSNAQILTAEISLDEFEVPPHSGVNVVSDYNGPITIQFSTPVSFVSGYFTYDAPLTLTAYNSSSQSIASVSSKYSDNFALSGDPGSNPNELLDLSKSGISELVISGSPDGSSFALDDLTYSTGSVVTPTPEPSAVGLVVLTTAALVLARRIRRTHCYRS